MYTATPTFITEAVTIINLFIRSDFNSLMNQTLSLVWCISIGDYKHLFGKGLVYCLHISFCSEELMNFVHGVKLHFIKQLIRGCVHWCIAMYLVPLNIFYEVHFNSNQQSTKSIDSSELAKRYRQYTWSRGCFIISYQQAPPWGKRVWLYRLDFKNVFG